MQNGHASKWHHLPDKDGTGVNAHVDGHGSDSQFHRHNPPAPLSLLPGKQSSSANGKQAGHKRSLSGSILSRLNFMQSKQSTASPAIGNEATSSSSHTDKEAHSTAPDDSSDTKDHHGHDPPNQIQSQPNEERQMSPAPESAMLLSQRVAKQRKRKGSLRKTALLGTGRLKVEGRERRNSLLQRAKNVEDQPQSQSQSHTLSSLPRFPPQQQTQLPTPTTMDPPDEQSPQIYAPSRGLLYQAPLPAPSPSSPSQSSAFISTPLDDAQPKLSLDTIRAATPPSGPVTAAPSTLASPIISPTSQSYTSTTDDDEALTLPNSTLKRLPMPSSGSYFPSQPSITRRRSSKKPSSPLSAIPVIAYGADEEYDYSETEWWGWVVLVVTWIVFVVGMGSSFGLWSWAWDVGETPYAPPELEDDPTLPIVGYYPALIILTGVMAWVWVVVAWVGMKYFKHAKMAGEDI